MEGSPSQEVMMAPKLKEPTLEDYLMMFLKKYKGETQAHIDGIAVGVMLEVAGSMRFCKFEYEGNPIRARVLVGTAPEHPEHCAAFHALLEDMDPAGDFSHRVKVVDGVVLYIFDLLVPECSFVKLMELWLANAHIEVSRIDLMLRSAQGVVGEKGKGYEFPLQSLRRN